jgi:RNA-directed DNA polymerase
MKENTKDSNKSLDQDKGKFVIEILDYAIKNKVDEKTKEKLINLIHKEIEQTGNVEKEILNRLERIEEIITKNPLKISNDTNSTTEVKPSTDAKPNSEIKPTIAKSHKPEETKSFLSLFNNSEGLKYLTHKFNDGKRDYESFIELCKIEFENGKTKYPNVPEPLLRRIEEFAFKSKPIWYIRNGNDKIYVDKGWSEPEFIAWYKKDINIHPDFDAKWKNEMITPFKETIEVRAGNLSKIINDSLELAFSKDINLFDIKFNIEDLNVAEFYTDVDRFQQALFHIFSTIKEKAEKNSRFKLDISYINENLENGKYKKLIIIHLNSEATKNSNDPEFAKGDLKTIQLNLWGLCNYEILAKFPNGYFRRIILTDDNDEYKNIVSRNKSLPISDIASVNGFTHILKFY